MNIFISPKEIVPSHVIVRCFWKSLFNSWMKIPHVYRKSWISPYHCNFFTAATALFDFLFSSDIIHLKIWIKIYNSLTDLYTNIWNTSPHSLLEMKKTDKLILEGKTSATAFMKESLKSEFIEDGKQSALRCVQVSVKILTYMAVSLRGRTL